MDEDIKRQWIADLAGAQHAAAPRIQGEEVERVSEGGTAFLEALAETNNDLVRQGCQGRYILVSPGTERIGSEIFTENTDASQPGYIRWYLTHPNMSQDDVWEEMRRIVNEIVAGLKSNHQEPGWSDLATLVTFLADREPER